jgi:hypothetical protein
MSKSKETRRCLEPSKGRSKLLADPLARRSGRSGVWIESVVVRIWGEGGEKAGSKKLGDQFR